MTEHREVERTYAPAARTDLPDLSSLPGVAEVGPPTTDHLVAVYFDTADFALTRAGVSLRRRTGGPDAGWHLKIPAREGRDEIRVPLSRALHRPPASLRRCVVSWVRQAPLVPIATITTTRTARALLGDDGAALAELADDVVCGTPVDGSPVSWREWELELAGADGSLLEAADRLMAGIGVEPSRVQRKLLHVVGAQLPDTRPLARVGRGSPASRVLHRRLAEQVEELKRRDSEVRRHQDEGVHRARVACRRLRAALATYRPLVDGSVTDPIRDEIRWLGLSLSDARDVSVVRERLRPLVDVEAADLMTGAARARLDKVYAEGSRAAWVVVEQTLSSDRYLALLDALDDLVADPPWTTAATMPAKRVLPPLVRRDWRRLERRMARVAAAADPDTALHDVRKDAKRLMYAVETLEPVWGKEARRLARATHKLTSHLGERQDSVTSRPVLLEIGQAAHAAGEDTMIWGVLVARVEQRRAALDVGIRARWERLSRRKLRRWLL